MLSSPDPMPGAASRVESLRLDQLRSFTMPAEVLPQFQPAGTLALSAPPVFEVAEEHNVSPEIIEQARAAAQAAGYAQGWAEGIRQARATSAAALAATREEEQRLSADRKARTGRAVDAIDLAAARLERRALATVEQMEDAIIDSAFTIAEAIVGAVLRENQARGALALRRAMAMAPAGERVTVAVHPDDYATLTEEGTEGIPAAAGRDVTLVEDASLDPGDAVASWGSTSADARLSTAVQRVREVLGQ